MSMDAPDLRHIVVTWDLDEGTGLAVRYGDMAPQRAAALLGLAARIVAEHADLIDELSYDEEEVEYELDYSEDNSDEEEDDE